MLPAGSKNVFCTFEKVEALNTCSLNQTIDSEDYVIGSSVNATIKLFDISYKEEVKHMPNDIGEKFPYLSALRAMNCSLTIVLKSYFKNMRKLHLLSLSFNKITSIEADSFKDLIKLKNLWLDNNMIETLDENLFKTMITLGFVKLNNNKIKFLSPETFKIFGVKLEYMDLKSNVCIDKLYGSKEYDLDNLHNLELNLKTNCTRLPEDQ